MATIKSAGYKYHSCETNRIEALLTGNTFAQLALNPAEFQKGLNPEAGKVACQNGMLLVSDDAAGMVRLPVDEDEVVYLHYSAPLHYDVRSQGTADFAVGVENDMNPVLIPLQFDDKFTLDGVVLGVGVTLENVVGKYGVVNAEGFIEFANTAPSVTAKQVFEAIKVYTMPHGGVGVKVKVVRSVLGV